MLIEYFLSYGNASNFDFKYMGEQEDYYKKWFCLYEIYIFLSQFFGGLYSDFNFCCTHLENSS